MDSWAPPKGFAGRWVLARMAGLAIGAPLATLWGLSMRPSVLAMLGNAGAHFVIPGLGRGDIGPRKARCRNQRLGMARLAGTRAPDHQRQRRKRSCGSR